MDIRAVVVRTAAEAAGKVVPFSGPLVAAFLSDALAVQDAQLLRLREIDQKIQALIDGPGRAGRLKLDELRIPNRKPDDVERLLAGAADDFFGAISLQDEGSFAMAQACLDLAQVRALQRDPDAMRHYATKGYHTARQAMFTLTERERTKKGAPVRQTARDQYLRQLRHASLWFEELEFRAAALGDPQPNEVFSPHTFKLPFGTEFAVGNPDSEMVAWRQGAELDYWYVKVWRYGVQGYKPPRQGFGNWASRFGSGEAWREFLILPSARWRSSPAVESLFGKLAPPDRDVLAGRSPWSTKPLLNLDTDR